MDADRADVEDEPGDTGDETADTGSGPGDTGDGSDAPTLTGRAAAAVAWIVGGALLLVGIAGLAGASGNGALPFVLGLIVTPRTRAELAELCAILAAGRE